MRIPAEMHEAYLVTYRNHIEADRKMKIFLLGATGMIGARVLDEALARGHEVTAAARRPQAARDGVRAVSVDATDAAALARAARGHDVIVAATSPRSTGDAMADATGVARAVIAAARETSARLLQVGGAGSLNLPDGSSVADHVPEPYHDEALAMRAVRDLVAASNVDWTILAPAGQIAPGERRGKFRLGATTLMVDAEGRSAISAEDYAVALVDEIERPAHRRALFTLAY